MTFIFLKLYVIFSITAIFERLRNILHEGEIDTRVQYMVEVMFAVRKDHFKVSTMVKVPPSIFTKLSILKGLEAYF